MGYSSTLVIASDLNLSMPLSSEIRGRVYGGFWLLAATIVGYRYRPHVGLAANDVIAPLNGLSLVLATGMSLTVLEGLTGMQRAADKISKHVTSAPDGPDLGGLFTAKTVGFVIGMAGLGTALRQVPYPGHVEVWAVTIIWLAVSLALVMGAAGRVKRTRLNTRDGLECNQMPWFSSN